MKRDLSCLIFGAFFLACGSIEAVAHALRGDWLTVAVGGALGILPAVVFFKLSEVKE